MVCIRENGGNEEIFYPGNTTEPYTATHTDNNNIELVFTNIPAILEFTVIVIG